jgi:sulfide:quinone oxidoreductase
VILDNKSEIPFDLFLGIPKHCVPAVVARSGMTENGWIPVDSLTLKTKYPNVYAIGDVTSVGTPKAGVFSEGAARTVAATIIAELNGGGIPPTYDGEGTCYIEFGRELVGRVDVKFLTGVKPTGKFYEPSETLVSEKEYFGSSRREKWFGLK